MDEPRSSKQAATREQYLHMVGRLVLVLGLGLFIPVIIGIGAVLCVIGKGTWIRKAQASVLIGGVVYIIAISGIVSLSWPWLPLVAFVLAVVATDSVTRLEQPAWFS